MVVLLLLMSCFYHHIQSYKSIVIQVAASFAPEGSIMSELKQWNELYGDGGSRKKQQLTYFL